MKPERAPPSVVELLPDPMLLVSSDGLVRAANDASAAAFNSSRHDLLQAPLFGLVIDPPDRVRDYLHRCAGTRQPLPGALTVRGADGASIRRRCEGWVVKPLGSDGPAIIALRLLRTDAGVARFADLTRQIGELTAEIGRRRHAEAQLELLAEAPARLLASLTVEDVHRALGELARRLVSADAHAIWQFDKADRVWRVVWHDGLSDTFVKEIAAWQGAPADAVPFESPLPVPDVSAVPFLADRRDVYAREGIASLLVIPLRIRSAYHGTIAAYYRTRTTVTDQVLGLARGLGNLGSSALTTAALYEFETGTRRSVELAEQRARFLAGAAAALAGSLDYQDTLRTVARLAVPAVADWCAVDMLTEDGTLQRLAVAHVDPSKVQLAHLLRERYPENPASPYGVHQVLRTNSSIMMTRIPESLITASARSAEHLEMLQALGLRSYMCVPLATQGRAFGVLTFVAAESGREYTEDDLRLAEDVASRAALAVENAKAYDEARRANQLKDDFLATLSHELRTPLNAILGYIRMMRAGALAPERRPQALEVIERNAAALNRMVEDVLDVSRVVAGKVRLNVQPVEVPDVVQDAIATVSPAADAKGIRVQSTIDQSVPPVSGDPSRLQQVVWNLLSNAVKFTPRGGRVQVRVERANSHVEIVVADTGIGVAPDFLPHIFERFRQADARFSREHGGLGLGLAIARHFVELHGGVITAASPGPNEGTTFRVRLPLMIVHVHGPEPAPLPHPTVEPGSQPSMLPPIREIHVLAVDDDPDSRALLAEVLQTAGARVTLAGSVTQALDALDVETPHVIISDIGMPEMDGLELVRRLRRHTDEGKRNLPAAALTAYARSEDRIRALEAGFQMHLAKPINPSELIAAVRTLAGRTGETPS